MDNEVFWQQYLTVQEQLEEMRWALKAEQMRCWFLEEFVRRLLG
jgi:hypothetical protein